ncbi:MAG: General stress protein CTC [Acidimicrobiales bacterium]|nr:MAG: 50S ribosomal protein L25 [Actinomycetota bacterium]MBV6507775.1 General stress protein CTC [Acidimicrobiales bacterium]RIK05933.1 MAG: 50S ribosomal protein L25 [Acidobacteriota bacterium]
MDQVTVVADTGRALGTRSSKRLRSEGRVPGVVYGLGQESVVVSVAYPDLRRALTTDAGLNALIDLQINGESQLSLVKDLQRDPVRRDVIHVDFLRIDPTAEVTVEVPISVVGEASEVHAAEGITEQVLTSLTVHCRPDSIPDRLEIDVTNMTMDDTYMVRDLVLPAGVTTDVNPDDPVVAATLTRAALVEEEEVPEGEEGEVVEGEEGEVAEGEAAEAGGGEPDEEG